MNLQKIKNSAKAGFTLIELLVVITIIGILATGATATYTSQIQKARDTTRINDIKALQSGVEQFYQDDGEYPMATANDFSTDLNLNVNMFLEKLPSDSKHKQPCNGGTICGYIYGTSVDNNNILYGEYEISTGFENSGNRTKKAAEDSGDDDLRYELGIDISDITNHNTSNDGTTVLESAGTCKKVSDGTTAGNATDSIYIAGNCL